MPINWQAMQGPAQPKTGVVAQGSPQQAPQAQAPTAPDMGSSDMSGLIGGLKKLFDPSTSYSNPNVGTGNAPGMQQQAQQQGVLQQALQQNTQLGNNPNNTILQNAQKEMGLGSNDPTLKSYMQKANPNLDPSNTPWCAGFVGSVLNASGLKGTGSLAAKSYLNFGTPTRTPSQGDIAVFNDLTGQGRPEHGHVGFVQSIDQKTGMVTVLGGNQSGQVSSKQYPLSMVAGFRVPPNGQQVKQFAQQQGIQNPQQLSQLPNKINDQGQPQQSKENGNQSNSSFEPAKGMLRNYEQFQSKASWDKNAYRTGYGSDTVTHADGTISKVTKDTVVNQADAERDLDRRTKEFQQGAAKQVGPGWNKLPANTQAALTSVAYNYGSLPKRILPAVRSGDINKIADAVHNLGKDNGGENKSRRSGEAALIRNSISPQASNNTNPWEKPKATLAANSVSSDHGGEYGIGNDAPGLIDNSALMPAKVPSESHDNQGMDINGYSPPYPDEDQGISQTEASNNKAIDWGKFLG